MASVHTLRSGIRGRDVGIALASLLSTALLLPVQITSMILFDTTDVDAVVPPLVFMTIVPAIITVLVPSGLALHYYDRSKALTIATAALLVNGTVAAYLTQFYGTCGGTGC